MKNASVSNMDYICFGHGHKALVMLPGLGDGLRTVKGTALPMSWMYRQFSHDYTVYAFSRRNDLSKGSSTRDMARDLNEAMNLLGLNTADILGVSMGGMIAQWLAIDYPHRVGKLVLVVTCAESNPILTESINEWLTCISEKNHTGLMHSNLRRIYSESYYRKNRWMVPMLGALIKPKSYDRFRILASACLTHNAAQELPKISAPTYVIGGKLDHVLGGEASRQIADSIPLARLKMYPQWGHGLYEEAPGFLRDVLQFLQGGG